jgi:hypothetical protein
MIEDYYKYVAATKGESFMFVSEGIKGTILKFVEFTPLTNDDWNLGFGDFKNGEIDDIVMTNNQDVIKVIRTVAQITIEFFKKYPHAIVVIKPVDEKRKKLYNIVFQRHFAEIDALFDIIAYLGIRKEIYHVETIYDSFELSLKNSENGK